MKLIVNVSNNLGGGGLQVALSFLEECKNFGEHVFHVFAGPSVAEQFDTDDLPKHFRWYRVPPLPFYRFHRYLSALERKIRPDAVFSVFGPSYWRPRAPHLVGFAQGHYIYPDAPFWNFLPFRARLTWRLKKQVHLCFFSRDADALVCETEDASERLQRLFPDKRCFTVSNTCGAQFTVAEQTAFSGIEPAFREGVFRLLTVSKAYPHKNLEIIGPVLDRLEAKGIDKVHFLLTVSQADYERMFAPRYWGRVSTLGPVPVCECPAVYRLCDAVFLPSLLECFSANYPEAMASGKPILTSDLGFAHTVCGDAALYFDPVSPADIANTVERLMKNKELQDVLIHNGKRRLQDFPDARQRAEAYLKICQWVSEHYKSRYHV